MKYFGTTALSIREWLPSRNHSATRLDKVCQTAFEHERSPLLLTDCLTGPACLLANRQSVAVHQQILFKNMQRLQPIGICVTSFVVTITDFSSAWKRRGSGSLWQSLTGFSSPCKELRVRLPDHLQTRKSAGLTPVVRNAFLCFGSGRRGSL